MIRRALFFLGPIAFTLSLFLPMDKGASVVVGTILWMGIWWIGEVVPLAITALLPLVIAPVFGISPAKEISLNYAKSPVFLFLGGFILAKSLEKYNIHKFLAYHIIKVFGKSSLGVFLGISLASYLLSMWISNTSTTLIMIPLILSLQAGGLLKALAFASAYSASIGGMATLVGTPPNIIYAGITNVNFTQWIKFGLPYSLTLEILFVILSIMFFKLGFSKVDIKVEEVKMSSDGIKVLVIFLLTALAWITLPFILKSFGIKGINDSTVAIISAITLFVFGLINWNDIANIPWDALLLFGGGFDLSDMIVKGNLSEILMSHLKVFSGYPVIFFVAMWSLFVLILTEFASNTSISAMTLPLAYSFAQGIGMDALALAAVVAISASGAFMLPVATPPNMLVYSFKLITLKDMLKIGVIMNIIALILNILITYNFAP